MTGNRRDEILRRRLATPPGQFVLQGPSETGRYEIVAMNQDGFHDHVAICDTVPSSEIHVEANADFFANARSDLEWYEQQLTAEECKSRKLDEHNIKLHDMLFDARSHLRRLVEGLEQVKKDMTASGHALNRMDVANALYERFQDTLRDAQDFLRLR